MDARAWCGVFAGAYAIWLVWDMAPPALHRLLRMKWNAYWRNKQRERMHQGFDAAIRRSPNFGSVKTICDLPEVDYWRLRYPRFED